mgnify:CR=1 FL=1|jgi:IclR family pca regulon transcriptional regulator
MTIPEADTEVGSLLRRDWIAGLEKGLSIIEAFDAENTRLTASQAGLRCGLTRTAARRYLLTLTHLGYVGTDGKLFWLTPRVLRLGHSYLESARLPRVVQPYLQRITTGTGEVGYVGVLDGDEIVYIARSGVHRHMNTGYMLGSRVQAQVTAGGLLMIALQGEAAAQAWLDRHGLKAYTSHTMADKTALARQMAVVRQQGWALSEQQLEMNYRGIAVPLYDRHGDVLGSLSVTMPMNHESSADAVARVLPVLQDTARSMRQVI